jgi:hypothetical protein
MIIFPFWVIAAVCAAITGTLVEVHYCDSPGRSQGDRMCQLLERDHARIHQQGG